MCGGGWGVAIQGGEGLSAVKGTGKIQVNEWQKKKHKRTASIHRREVESPFPIMHSTTSHESKSFKIQRALIKLCKFCFEVVGCC